MNLNSKIINFPTNGSSISDYDGGQYYFNNFSTLINKIGSNPNDELVLIDSQHSCNSSSSTSSTSTSMSPLSGIFKLINKKKI